MIILKRKTSRNVHTSYNSNNDIQGLKKKIKRQKMPKENNVKQKKKQCKKYC